MPTDLNMPDKMDLRSMDVSEKNRAKLKNLFPGVFVETRNEKGELVESIDFGKLKTEMGTFNNVFEKRRERYGMDWPGKKDCMKLIQQPSVATLKPSREDSVNFDDTENLFIEGDNLEVLKLLQRSYYGKIKMIYIDPPYNTGKEFIYPDKYSETLETYLAYAGLVDDVGKNFRVYSVAAGALLICLEDEITHELIDAVAEVEPTQFICLDRGFKGNDQLKANAVQTFATRNQGTDSSEQIVFRTV